jgi:hypothetical protein
MIKEEAVLKYPTMQKYLKNCFDEELEPYDDNGKIDHHVTTATEDATTEDATTEDANTIGDGWPIRLF